MTSAVGTKALAEPLETLCNGHSAETGPPMLHQPFGSDSVTGPSVDPLTLSDGGVARARQTL